MGDTGNCSVKAIRGSQGFQLQTGCRIRRDKVLRSEVGTRDVSVKELTKKHNRIYNADSTRALVLTLPGDVAQSPTDSYYLRPLRVYDLGANS